MKIQASKKFKTILKEVDTISNNKDAVISYCKFCSIEDEESTKLEYYALCSSALKDKIDSQLSGDVSTDLV